jgi:hypothetical protein
MVSIKINKGKRTSLLFHNVNSTPGCHYPQYNSTHHNDIQNNNSITTLRTITLNNGIRHTKVSTKALWIMAINIVTLTIMTVSITRHSIMTFSM